MENSEGQIGNGLGRDLADIVQWLKIELSFMTPMNKMIQQSRAGGVAPAATARRQAVDRCP
jgi:hypothetical protein